MADLSLLSMPRESKDAIVKLLLLCAVTLDESGSIWASSAGYLPRADVGAMEVVAELGRIAEAGGQDPCQIHLPFQELEMILPHELDGKDGHAIEGWACKTLSRSICRSEWLALWRCRCPSPSLEQTSAEHSSAWPWPHTFCCLTPQLLDGYHGCGKILENSDFLVDNKAVCCGAVGAVSGVSRSVPTAYKSKGLHRSGLESL